MLVYWVLIIVVLGAWSMVYGHPYEDRGMWSKRCCRMVCIAIVLVAALRGSTVGADTASYVRDYNIVSQLSLWEIMERFPENPAYFLVSKVFADRGISVQIWFGLVAFFYIHSATKIIERFSSDVGLSYIMLITLGFFGFSLAGLKQIVAMSILQYAFSHYYDKRYIRFLAFVFLASFFHRSCLIFIAAFLITFLAKRKNYYFLLTIGFVVWLFAFNFLLHNVLQFISYDRYSDYLLSERESNGTLTSFFVFLLIQVASLLYLRYYSEEYPEESRIIFGLSYAGMLAQLIAISITSSFRLAMYFSFFSIILFPNCLHYEQNAYIRRILKIGATMTFIFFFWYTNRLGSSIVPYVFCWS